jgi:hypothetical protein
LRMVPASVTSNCSEDASAKLTSWIKTIPNGSTISFPKHACYRLDRPIHVMNRHSLTFLGGGAMFRRFSLSPPSLTYQRGSHHYDNAYWDMRGGSDISMSNMSVVGPNVSPSTHSVAYYFEYAFGFFGVNGISLTNVSSSTVGGDGLLIGGEGGTSCDKNVRVNRLTVNNVGRQGIAIVCVNGATFDNVVLNHPGGLASGMTTGFDLEPEGVTASVRNVEIKRSRVSARIVAFSARGPQDVSNIYIHNNTVVSQDRAWAWLSVANGPVHPARHDWRVIANTVDVILSNGGLVFSGVTDIDVENNTSPVAAGHFGVKLLNDQGPITIAGNRFGAAAASWTAINSAVPSTVGRAPRRSIGHSPAIRTSRT